MKRGERNRGAAMVIVLCVMVVFLALAATVLLSGSVALTTARNNIIFERGKAQAVSLSELFARDMERDYTDKNSSLLHYVRNKIVEKKWPARTSSNKNDEGVVRKFTMDSDGEEHQIAIEMYWTWNESGTDFTGDETDLKDKDVHLIVEVISTLSDSEYRVKKDFWVSNIEENNDTATSEDYPYIWTWETTGRSENR